MRTLGSVGVFCTLSLFIKNSECSNEFERVGNMQLSLVNKSVNYATAEEGCHELNSRLAEVRGNEEWNVVRFLKIFVLSVQNLNA